MSSIGWQGGVVQHDAILMETSKKSPSRGSLPVLSAVDFQQIEHDEVESTTGISVHLNKMWKVLLAGSYEHNNSILS